MRMPLSRLFAAAWLGLLLHGQALAQAPLTSRPGEIIIKFKPNASAAERAAILADLGALDVQEVRRIGAKHARLGNRSVAEAVARYRGHAKVAYIEPNYIYHALAVPNDPRFPEMWGLLNQGQTGGLAGADIRATAAWDVTTGSSAVLVAVTDTGLDWTHPDLAANVFSNPGETAGNGIDDDGNGYIDDVRGWDFVNHDNDPYDDHGHGTHTSGTIAAIGNNGIGTVGVSWSARILPLKFLDAFGNGSTIEAINAIDYAARMKARVMNASWGGGEYSDALREAIQSAADSGMVFVAAAGNSGLDADNFPMYPAAYDVASIISVAATDHRDRLAGFSNYGLNSVDLGAPGVDVLSTLPGGYGTASGTSMAAPHVAGTLALMFTRFPNLDPLSAKNLLLSRVAPNAELTGRTVTGGRLDAFLAVSDPDNTPPGTLGTLTAVDPNGTRVTLHWTATGDDGATGAASRYEIRYAQFPLNFFNFSQGTPVSGAPQPAPAGSAETFTVTGLDFGTLYFFALRALDEFGNPSPLSNVASATTLEPPQVSVSPLSLQADLLTGQKTTRVLTISNQGEAELNARIGTSAGLPGGLAAGGNVQVIRTFVAPPIAIATPAPAAASTSSLAADVRPPSYPASLVPFDAGRTPARGPITASDVRVTNVAGGSKRILIAYSGGDVTEIRLALGAFPDLVAVDEMSVLNQVPTLDMLAAYDGVILVANNPFGDPAGVGNVLADYVDSGGALVMTLATFINGWEVGGRLRSGGYIPFGSGSGPVGASSLGTFDATHPIMAGVVAASGDLLGITPLAVGAEAVAMWSNGQPCVATKGKVVAVNVFVGGFGYWTGDIPLILHNAVLWSQGTSWLSAAPDSVVVPAGGQVGVVVTFDATDLEGGLYGATVKVESDDPATPIFPIPATLHVIGVADIALSGDIVNLESAQDYATDGAATQHRLTIEATPAGPVSLDLVAEGDYGDLSETATATGEGYPLGSVGGVGTDCSVAQRRFPIGASTWAALAADGVVDIHVQNSIAVNFFCLPNRHTVRLSYETRADVLDFGDVYAGGQRSLGITVRNPGTDVLTVQSVEYLGVGFSGPTGGFTLNPKESRRLEVLFAPAVAQPHSGSLVVHSDDPDEPTLSVPMTGRGIVPPDIAVTPSQIEQTLLTGTSTSRVVTIENQGGSDLDFSVSLEGAGASVVMLPGSPDQADPRIPSDPATALQQTGPPATLSAVPGSPGTREHETPLSNVTPAGYVPRISAPSVMSGATVLLVQDSAPWGLAANQEILTSNGISFDVVTTSALAGINLLRYQKVIIAGDQPTAAYARLTAQLSKLTNYVSAGGFLEAHTAGWGFAGGDASQLVLPGGVHIIQGFSGFNYFAVSSHPILAGVPNPVSGTAASHSYLTQLPANNTVLLYDNFGRPCLTIYPIGRGTVVAGGQTFEYSLAAGRDPGKILRNLIPYGLSTSIGWIGAEPLAGHVPPGGSAQLLVRLDAEGLLGGDYRAKIHLRSNDPDESDVVVPVTLTVDVAPDIALLGPQHVLESAVPYIGMGAVTQHSFPIAETPRGGARMVLEADGDFGDFFEYAVLIAEGQVLGEVGRLGVDCVQARGEFPIGDAAMAALAADGVVQARVTNTFDVEALCGVNQHRVTLSYRTGADSLGFGQVFVGSCDSLDFEIVNQGTDDLLIQPMSLISPGFQVLPGGGVTLIPPGGRQVVSLFWCPPGPGTVAKFLEVRSNDPNDPVLRIGIFGEALVPPEISVAPSSVEDALETGQTSSHTLVVHNGGGSDLVFELDLVGAAPETVAVRTANLAVQADPGHTEHGVLTSDHGPLGYRPQPVTPIRVAGARMLLVEENAPWGTAANEQVLAQNGIPFDVTSASALAALDLSLYDKVIVASDQTSGFYSRLASRAAQLDDFVRQGGVLEVHAAGWGFAGGDASLFTIPGGTRIFYGPAGQNIVLVPGHPMMVGVPSPFFGNSASHSYLGQFPADAEVLVMDDAGRPNLVVYSLGRGTVIAGGQTFEHGFVYGYGAGIILANMIPYLRAGSVDWANANPVEGRVGAGQSLAVDLRLDATGLGTSDLRADAVFESNDPTDPEVRVPILLYVTGRPDIEVQGEAIHVESVQPYFGDGAQTTHDLPITGTPVGGGTLELIADGDYGDFVENAAATLDGVFIGEVGRVGIDCATASGAFEVPEPLLSQAAANGVAHVAVQNSFDVNVFCAINQHRVRLTYHRSANQLDFGTVYLGVCGTRAISILNAGTEDLHVAPLGEGTGPFQISPAGALVLRPDSAVTVAVSFCPTQAGTFEAEFQILSDDPDEGELHVSLLGIGAIPADIAVAPASMGEGLLPGGSASRTLRIANSGGLPLHYRIEARGPAPDTTLVASAAGPDRPLSSESLTRAHAAYRSYPGGGPAAVAAPQPTLGLRRLATPSALRPSERANAVVLFADDVEGDVSGWSHYSTQGGPDLWGVSITRSNSGARSWRVPQHDFNNGNALETPIIDLSGRSEVVLTFRQWYNFDDCGGVPDFEPDGGAVEVMEQGTGIWQAVTPSTGYPYVIDDSCGNPLAFHGAYSHDTMMGPGFETAVFDLSAFAGRRISIRFHSGWDCGNCELNEGWFIDDVLVVSTAVEWLSTAPSEGVVAPGDVAEIAVGFDAGTLAPGEYLASLAILSDDPDEPQIDVPVRLWVAERAADLDVEPNTVNLGRRGEYMTCYLELPGGAASTIDPSSLRLDFVVPAHPTIHTLGDHDQDGIADLMVKFEFDAVRPLLPIGDPVPVLITGFAGDQRLMAREYVRVIRHDVTAPAGSQTFTAGQSVPIEWSLPADWQATSVRLLYSLDRGVTWTEITHAVQGTRYDWTVPNRSTTHALVRVDILDAAGLLASELSGEFAIVGSATAVQPLQIPVDVALANAPNPFSGAGTAIGFSLRAAGKVELMIFNAAGRRVKTLAREWMEAGPHRIRWDGRDEQGARLGSGIYFCRLRAPGLERTRRMTLIQ